MFREALKITNNSIIIALPMIFGLKLIELYTMFINSSANSNEKLIFGTVTLVLMIGLFAAGWFYIVKKTIETNKKEFIMEKDKYKEIFETLKKMPEGIAKYFLSFVLAYLIFIAVQILILPFVVILGTKLFGHLDEGLYQSIQQLAAYNITVNDFVNGLTESQLFYFAKWILLFFTVLLCLSYIFMLWIPEIMYSSRNPFIALGTSIVKLFKNFFSSIGIYLVIILFIIVTLFVMLLLPKHPLTVLFFECLKFYSYMYFTILIFTYYNRKFITNGTQSEVDENEEE